MPNKIDSDKIFINKAFELWYRVPDYQRPYVWGTDQVTDLLDDVTQWMYSRPDSEYFLGSIVLQERHNNGIVEYDLLDGQQRLSTCLMVYAVGRDLAKDARLEALCREVVFQQDDPFKNIPERLRIVYNVRDDVHEFVNNFIKPKGGTSKEAGLQAALKANDLSVRNMANAVLQIRNFFQQSDAPSVEDFFKFFGNKVLLVYVSSANLEDAFRMFTVLNDRGMKLRGSDILKTSNLRALREDRASDDEIRRWAKYWEQLEGELADDFDIFLSHLRSVLVKDKARLSLLQEFEEKDLIKHLSKFDDAVVNCAKLYDSSGLCAYLLELSQKLNTFYHKHQILKAEEAVKHALLVLVNVSLAVMKRGLKLLNIETVEEM